MHFEIKRHKRDLALLKQAYKPNQNIITEDGVIPLTYWINTENFGDLLSPWLYQKITGLPVAYSNGAEKSYIGIGSIMKYATNQSIIWGTGSFGTESKRQIPLDATYLAVRGPLTRARVQNTGVVCPAVYGDPALLTPMYYWPDIEPQYEVGIVLRWSEKKWVNRDFGPGVKKIYLKTDDIEGVLNDMLQCKRIITSSLHGLIIADAYGIPSAWLDSHTPKGGEFKFYDYFLTVNKVRHAQRYDMGKGKLDLTNLLAHFEFDGRMIDFNYQALLNACPLLEGA